MKMVLRIGRDWCHLGYYNKQLNSPSSWAEPFSPSWLGNICVVEDNGTVRQAAGLRSWRATTAQGRQKVCLHRRLGFGFTKIAAFV
jgi:hypothetical protein